MKKIVWLICTFIGILFARGELIQIMQDMEYAINLMQKGFLYDKKTWVDEGIKEFKALSRQLQHIDPRVYLEGPQRRDANVVSGIAMRNRENIEVLERFLNQDQKVKSIDAFGQILTGCMSCHLLSRGW
ncbi:hypothetical protein [Helicobacter marmotae]|uniref:Cytochrome C n=1 Tax=Helicobacter marmotae TaxID=152490 RepID=A0A3D8I261_9HELI|nr:hypothetical protein [Helicobacter marmotae]RDU59175.1 hypothetical protein CQA63_07810 [Helicobacter marmotae]